MTGAEKRATFFEQQRRLGLVATEPPDAMLVDLMKRVEPREKRTSLSIQIEAVRRRLHAYKLRRCGMTWTQIGSDMGVSSSRARQLAHYCWRKLGYPDVPLSQFSPRPTCMDGDWNNG